MSIADYRLLQEIQKQGLLTMRLNVLMSNAITTDAAAPPLLTSGITMGDGDEWLRVGGVKLAVDGGFEGGLMRQPYEEPWGEKGTFRGLQTINTERFVQVVRAFNQQEWRVATHAVGDAAIDLVLSAYEKAHAERSIAGRRWSIEHAFIGRPDHLPRIKALGLAISAQNHLYLAGPSLVKYWGAHSRGHHDAGQDVSRRRAPGILRHGRAGRALSSAVDDVPLRDEGYDHGRRAGCRSTDQPRAGDQDGHNQ